MGPALIVLGVWGLAVWWISVDPSTLEGGTIHYDQYVVVYNSMPIMGVGSIVIGILNTYRLADLHHKAGGSDD